MMTRRARIDLATYHIVQHGCAKNQVDGEVIGGLLSRAGLRSVTDPEEAELIVVNTCSFVEPAREESIDAILTEAERKETGRCRRLIVSGCLTQMFGEKLAAELPEVDLFLGTGEFHTIVDRLRGLSRHAGVGSCHASTPTYLYDADAPRNASGPSAYIKIADGCDNACAYCVIGRLRGRFRSRRPDDVLRESIRLVGGGAKELCLVSQDTGRYGADLAAPSSIPLLIERLARELPETWIRLLYLHPARVSDDLLERIARFGNVCGYLDVPMQHASTRLLALMNRPSTHRNLKALVKRIRRIAPGAAIRTTFIVGHPGETPSDFDRLHDFLREARLDHVGVFCYSREDGTPSASLPDPVPVEVADERRVVLMESQAVISEELNGARVGSELRVLVTGESEEFPGHAQGRAEFQAPEVDGVVLIDSTAVEPGAFRTVRIDHATCYDLSGSVVES